MFDLICSLIFCSLYSTCEQNHTVFFFLGRTYFIEHNILKVHPHCPKWQDLVFFYDWGAFHCSCVCVCVCVYIFYINSFMGTSLFYTLTVINNAAINIWVLAAAKSLQSCPTLFDPVDGSPPGPAVPGILQARTLEWVAISFSNAWKWKVKVKLLSRVRLLVTP